MSPSKCAISNSRADQKKYKGGKKPTATKKKGKGKAVRTDKREGGPTQNDAEETDSRSKDVYQHPGEKGNHEKRTCAKTLQKNTHEPAGGWQRAVNKANYSVKK